MEQKKVVIKIPAMADAETKQKAIEAAAKFQGIDSIAADLEEQIMIIIGQVDGLAIGNRLEKKIGTVELVSVRSVRSANEEEKERKEKERKKKEEKERKEKERKKKEEKEQKKKEERKEKEERKKKEKK